MRILFVRNDDIDPDVRVEKEVRSLLKDGHDIFAFGCDRTGHSLLEEERVYPEGVFSILRKRITYGYGGGVRKNLIPLLRFQLSIICYIFKNRKRIDVIHACDFNTAYVTGICARLIKKPFVYDIFDYYVDCYSVPNVLKKCIEKMDHKTIERAYRTIICSEEREKQINMGKNWPFIVVHNSPSIVPTNNEVFSLHSDLERKVFRLSYVGMLAKKRKLDSFVEYITRIKGVELHVAGFGELEPFFRDINSKASNVYFYGKVNYNMALSIESQCDAIVALYPLDNKNHLFAAPNKVYEGLMLGKPLLMIRGSGMSEIIGSNNFGSIIDFTESDIKKGIDELKSLDMYNTSVKMKQFFHEKYDWEIMDKRVRNIYQELLCTQREQ